MRESAGEEVLIERVRPHDADIGHMNRRVTSEPELLCLERLVDVLRIQESRSTVSSTLDSLSMLMNISTGSQSRPPVDSNGGLMLQLTLFFENEEVDEVGFGVSIIFYVKTIPT